MRWVFSKEVNKKKKKWFHFVHHKSLNEMYQKYRKYKVKERESKGETTLGSANSIII